MELEGLIFVIFGYLLGSILFAPLFGHLLKRKDITEESPDKNPGTANAFTYGGFWCGTLALCGDLAKGFLPVFLYLHLHLPAAATGNWLPFVMAAPVIGHIFPVFSRFKGGKGIATTFGCLLGLVPDIIPLGIFVLVFIFFSLIIRITPHYFRTIFSYGAALILMFLCEPNISMSVGFVIIVVAVMVRMATSKEQKEKLKVRLLWRH